MRVEIFAKGADFWEMGPSCAWGGDSKNHSFNVVCVAFEEVCVFMRRFICVYEELLCVSTSNFIFVYEEVYLQVFMRRFVCVYEETYLYLWVGLCVPTRRYMCEFMWRDMCVYKKIYTCF